MVKDRLQSRLSAYNPVPHGGPGQTTKLLAASPLLWLGSTEVNGVKACSVFSALKNSFCTVTLTLYTVLMFLLLLQVCSFLELNLYPLPLPFWIQELMHLFLTNRTDLADVSGNLSFTSGGTLPWLGAPYYAARA